MTLEQVVHDKLLLVAKRRQMVFLQGHCLLLHELLLGLILLSLQEHLLVGSQLADVGLMGCLLQHLSIVIKLCLEDLMNVDHGLLDLLHGIGLSQVIERGYEL